jgi:hypothetical protein
MSASFETIQIDLPSETKSTAGRYDKLHAAGMATRFVKGISGNPRGRPKQRQSDTSTRELAALLREEFRLA